jgi:hypothetical protein
MSKTNTNKSRTKSGSSKKPKISTKFIAAIIVGIVAIAGIGIVFNSFAKGYSGCNIQYGPWRILTKNVTVGSRPAIKKIGQKRVVTRRCRNQQPKTFTEYRYNK